MAVSRRQKENDTFNDIAQTLPLSESAKELDKASVLRVAIHYLKLRDVLADCDPQGDTGKVTNLRSLTSSVPNFSKDIQQALDGFMMMISKDGRILYATDSISQFLGLRQVDVIGVHIQDIVHPQDFMDMATIFHAQGRDIPPEMEALGKSPLRRNIVMRMRCAFTPSVRSITRCSNFKPIFCSIYLKFSNKKIKEGEFLGMVMLCKLASTMRTKELCVGAFFKTKHALDLSYTTLDTRIRWILGFDPADMVGLKAYEYFHPVDLLATSSCHTNLLVKGYSHSPCYRFMNRSGDWVWVRSKSHVTYDSVTHLPNGLSIYTWIVRYDEEDDRMKAIMSGEDPGTLGVKENDLSAQLSTTAGNIDVSELCNPHSSPAEDGSTSEQTSSPVLSTPVMTEYPSVPPPNSNPFQSTPSAIQSPVASSGYVSPSPSLIPSSPYTSYSCSPEKPSSLQGFNHYQLLEQGPATSFIDGQSDSSYSRSPTKPVVHRTLATCNQSSLDSQHEMSPPFTSCDPTPTNSPSSSFVYSSPADSTSYSYNSPPTQQSPYADAALPYMDALPKLPTLTANAQAVFMPADTGFSDCPYPTADTFVSMATAEMFPNISQNQLLDVTESLHYQDPMFASTVSISRQPNATSYCAQAKARYTHVAVAGRSNDTRRSRTEGMEIKNISKWLQDSAPVH